MSTDYRKLILNWGDALRRHERLKHEWDASNPNRDLQELKFAEEDLGYHRKRLLAVGERDFENDPAPSERLRSVVSRYFETRKYDQVSKFGIQLALEVRREAARDLLNLYEEIARGDCSIGLAEMGREELEREVRDLRVVVASLTAHIEKTQKESK